MIQNLSNINLSIVSDMENVPVEKISGRLDRVDSTSYLFTAGKTQKSNPLPRVYKGTYLSVAIDKRGGVRCYLKRFDADQTTTVLESVYQEFQLAAISIQENAAKAKTMGEA